MIMSALILSKLGWEVLPHPSFSLVLALCDSCLTHLLKKELQKKKKKKKEEEEEEVPITLIS
jgi:hypothetical protein